MIASNLSCTLRSLESYGLVRLNRSSETCAMRLEALAPEFLVVLDRAQPQNMATAQTEYGTSE